MALSYDLEPEVANRYDSYSDYRDAVEAGYEQATNEEATGWHEPTDADRGRLPANAN